MHIEIPNTVRTINDLIVSNGGRPLLVGGAVVDHLSGLPVKDWDIEVYGLSLSQLETILADYKPAECGKAFGILKLSQKIVGADVDISVPRIENKIGKGHKKFSISFDSTITPKQAAMRRDLTFNALAYDMVTHEIVDFFGGIEDFKNGVCRATSCVSFVEDPLRAFRVMQLLARKAKTVTLGTKALCRHIFVDLITGKETLPRERIFEEFAKLLMKAKKPSVGLEFLKETGGLTLFPELAWLVGCRQNKAFHPEGDVWRHTMQVVDAAAVVRDANVLPEGWALPFMFAALTHDLGKPKTTLKDLTAHGHDQEGAKLVPVFMDRLTADRELIERVTMLVKEHMQLFGLMEGRAKMPAYRRLNHRCRLDVLAWLSRCDSIGSQVVEPVTNVLTRPHGPSRIALEKFEVLGEKKVQSILLGRHLIAAGYKPSREFTTMLNKAFEAQLDGETDIDKLLAVAIGE